MSNTSETSPQLIAIAAMASNRVIGRDGKLPWHLPEDLKFFKKTTLGHPVLMGRKTFDSIVAQLGKPLPGRENIVLSRTMTPQDGVTVIRELTDLNAVPKLTSPIFLIGGAQLYETLLSHCSELLLTYIETPYAGDAFFPPFEDLFEFQDTLGVGEGFEFRRYRRK